MCEILPKYLEDPKKYCNKINSLLDQNSNEWQTVWKAAIPELSNLPSNQLSTINVLLKPIESAFKSKDSRHRVQAFECWSHFLTHCPKIPISHSEKLWAVLVVPLNAHNHSVYIVLNAKLKTWDVFVDASFQLNQNALKTAIPTILKCLYGPHALDPACSFVALAETCGQLYLKIMTKCSTFVPEIKLIFSYLERAIPPLSNLQNTQKLAKLIWNEALKTISESGWLTEHFNYLMATLENLFSDSKNDGFQLISNFLAILFDIHCSFPPERLTPHMNLVVRCLFHPPVKVKVVCNIMNSLLKSCEDPYFCFYEIDRVLMDKTKHDRTDVDVLWIATATCYTKWIKDSGNSIAEIDPSLKILLFPFEHISEISYETDRFNAIMKQWKVCYEECVSAAGSERFMPVLFEKLEAGIDDKIPRLIAVTYMCNAILTVVKFSDGFIHMKRVLLKISKNMPDIKTLTDSKLKTFAAKYIVTVKAFVQLQKTCWEDFSHVIKTFSSLLKSDVDEVTSKENSSKSDADSDSSSKLSNEGSCNKIATPTRKRTSFLDRLLSPVVKKAVVESPIRSPSTSKTYVIDNDEVQFIEMKPKPKNSPMTQHQIEKAKTKQYIPALYQDLSQSQSQLSQTESENLFVEKKKPSTLINAELFEENANLPSTSNISTASPIIPRSLSFHTGLNSPVSERSGKVLSKVSLFNDDKKPQDGSDSDSSVEVIPKNKTSTDDTSDIEILDKQPIKRKSLRENETPNDITPVKRSKRLRDRVEKRGDSKTSNEMRKFITTPVSVQKSGEKSLTKNDKSTNNKVDEPEIIDLEMGSSNTVNVVDRVIDSVSRTANSLMNLKDDIGKSGGKRKSLRKRSNGTPSLSSTPRKYRSKLSDVDSKKSTNSDDSVSDQNSTHDTRNEVNKQRKPSIHLVVNEILQVNQIDETGIPVEKIIHVSPSEAIIGEKESVAVEKNTSEVITSSTKATLTDSVILVEEEVAEVISIDDSESVNSVGKLDESKITPISDTASVPAQNSSDESTFYEGSDQNMTGKDQPTVVLVDQNAVEDGITSDDHNTANSKPVIVQKVPISPEVISSVESNNAVENNAVDEGINQCRVESSTIEGDPSSSAIVLENSRADIPDESACTTQSSSKKDTNHEIMSSEDIVSSSNEATIEIETSALLSNQNSRGYMIRKLAQGPDFTINASKSPKLTSPKNPQRIKEKRHFPSPIASRTGRILFEKNQQPSTPPHRATSTQEEIETSISTPRSFPGKSILKTPDSKRSDANQNISSPKSPKLRVSFAEKNEVKIFQADDESDSDSLISTGDKLSNENLLNEKLQSQDMLYSPLQNCKDGIEELLGYIFSSAGSRQALKFFKSIGIDKVGQLASMSTLTASSIPAGDNRVRRMRHALKKYDEDLEKKQRRRPSTRRSEFKNVEISCLKDLLIDVEPTDAENDCDEDVQTTSSEPPSRDEDLPNTDISTVVNEPAVNKTENNEAKDDENPIIASVSKSKEPNLEPIESESPVIVDNSSEEYNKSVEKEFVAETENKENVDPVSESVDVSTLMEVDEHPCDIPKATNETINDSADYVCTDTTIYEQNVNDRRSITIRDIRQYTTVIDSSSEQVSVEVVSQSTETSSKEAVVVLNETNDSAGKSISLFNENKTIPQSKNIIESPETAIDSQETSISDINSVILIPSLDRDQQNNTENEQVESNVDENIVEDMGKKVENRENQLTENENVINEGILSDHQNNEISVNVDSNSDTSTADSEDQKDIIHDQNISVMSNERFIIERYPGIFAERMRKWFPCCNLTENHANEMLLNFLQELHTDLDTIGFKMHISKK